MKLDEWLSNDASTKVNVRGRTMWSNWSRTLISGIVLSFACSAVQAQPGNRSSTSESNPIAQDSFFFVGGSYVGDSAKPVMHGQMYVEKLTPTRRLHPYPIVLIHGAGQTATNWMGTPDGREGWAKFFVAQGYEVYMVDQPARGRSAWQEGIDGKLSTFDAKTEESLFSVPEQFNLWPQAKFHTQWPGSGPSHGKIGDPVFDQFYSTQVQFLASNAETETLIQHAAAALLDKIGPAIVLTHSQSGPFGWLIADARPKLVKAIIAVEPSGPPFQNEIPFGTDKARAWGVTDIPMTYDPPITDPSQLQIEQQATPDKPDLVRCWSQKAPVHSLVNLSGIPVMMVTSEASYHSAYDHCTARYLKQAGVNTDFVRLPDVGIHGNAHMMMLEKNNLQIAGLISSWLGKNVK
ncbi:alpha/beta hydrolase [Caballeronia sp. LZ043]|uniref:alpha/beta hydrolase n=1 Tax=Caballeronia sp. LZ043 TaxID=3038569 RepID=UPI00285A6563|nr:alpha/beta hydrolase [Caballeronia sp. LZ043]MDR5824988.1 alpha/beta hydrolase [Caballeronia sp. LZ043]